MAQSPTPAEIDAAKELEISVREVQRVLNAYDRALTLGLLRESIRNRTAQ